MQHSDEADCRREVEADTVLPTLQTATIEITLQILSFLSLEDLLRFSRVNRRYHTLVKEQGDSLWHKLYLQDWPDAPSDGTPIHGKDKPVDKGAALEAHSPPTWRDRYKQRFVVDKHRRWQRGAAQRLKLRSAIQLLERDIFCMKRSLASEAKTLTAVQVESAAIDVKIQEASASQLAEKYWQPVAVAKRLHRHLDQTPLDLEGKQRDLKQKVRVSRLEVSKLRAMLASKETQLADAKHKLEALQP